MSRIKYIGIYRMISPSGKVYIGQSWDITNRKSRYKTLTCKNQAKLYASLVKHGFESHNFTILILLPCNITQDHINFYEHFYFNVYSDSGYEMLNLRLPGSFGKHPIESRIKNSISHKGHTPWNKGIMGAQVAWNKGVSICRRSYSVKRNGEVIIINDLKKYCRDNNISYGTFGVFLNAKRFYSTVKKYKNYERI